MTVSSYKRTSIITMFIMVLIVSMGSTNVSAQEYKEAFNAGREAAQAKDYTTAIAKFAEAVEGAIAENDDSVERSARNIISKIEYSLGLKALKKNEFDAALTHFENGIASYPTNAKNYLARASTLKKMNLIDDSIAGFAQTIEIATATQDTKTARQAKDAIRGHYIFLASSALSRNGARANSGDADEALDHIQSMLQYIDADSDALYYTAESQKIKGEFDAAIMSADAALEMHRGSRTDKAKIYFVKGEALMSSGDLGAAKSAFTNAAYGSYRASAEHFIETLGTNN